MSMAASWSWGASLGVGVAIMHTRGPTAFAIWTALNVAAIPFLGMVYTNIKQWRHLIKLRAVIAFMFIIQGFAVLINTQLMFEGLTGGIDIEIAQVLPETIAMFTVMAIALGLVLFIDRTGLRGSMFTDMIQYGLQFTGVVLLVIAAIAIGGFTTDPNIPTTTMGDIYWVIPVSLGLLVGPSIDAMQFQRLEQAKPDERFMASLFGGLWFGLYMVAVTAASLFIVQDSLIVALCFLLVVLSITTSTIDSATAGMQRLGGRKPALVVAAGIVILWPLLIDLGITGIFAIYSSSRLYFVTGLLVVMGVLYFLGRDIRDWTGDDDPGTTPAALRALGDLDLTKNVTKSDHIEDMETNPSDD